MTADVHVEIAAYSVNAVPPGIAPMDRQSWEIRVELRGEDRWAVVHHKCCLNRDGEWEWEPSPSNRDDDFLDRCRFGREDALARAVRAAPRILVNGRDAAGLTAWWAEQSAGAGSETGR
jgi:hypothetical protein